METKAEVLLKRMERLYKNIYNLLDAFNKASQNKSNSTITAELYDENNNIKQIKVNSFLQLQQEINRIDNNFKSLITQPSYILASDGTLSMYEKTTFLTAEYLDSFYFDGSKCIIDKESMIEDFVYPTIKLPIIINKDILQNTIYCKIYEITKGWDEIQDNIKEINLQYLNNNGKLFYKDYSRSLKIEKQKVKYHGKFTIENVAATNISNTFNVILDKIRYTSINNLGDNINLQVGDILVSETGMSKYQIKDLDTFNRIVTIVRIGGNEIPKVGINQLIFNQIIESKQNIINIPIKPNQKLVIFLSVENKDTIGYPSVGIKIDTEEFTVTHNNQTYTIDEYFQKYVTNFSQYLNTLINDASIPYSLGIKPDKPVLNKANFRVVQINKHLLDQQTQNDINELNKKKQLLQNDIDAKQLIIDQTQIELNAQKFNSIEEKSYRLNRIQLLRTEINTAKSNLLAITRDIDNNASKYNIKNTKPKYKVIGFWDIQEVMYSPVTLPQHIIKYEVQYRYLRKDVDINEATTYKMISNGKEITVAFSNWNELNTRCLNKIEDIDGKIVWESNILDSVDDININQCAISINEGESIEIKVRAISEAGYPISPMKSDWSEPIRIDFPDSLKTGSLQATIAQNETDLRNAEFNAILQNLGVLNHLSGTIQEAEKTYFHSAKDIASGQFTQEQKNIPLDECIKNIYQELNILKATDVNDNIVVSFVDFNGESYTIKNNTTLEIFAGNYTDTVDTANTEQYGTIITKRGYIKIRNNNKIPVELNSLIPGNDDFTSTKAPYYYNVPLYVENSNKPLQSNKQIIYFRNTDLIGSKIGGTLLNNDFYKLVEDNNKNTKFTEVLRNKIYQYSVKSNSKLSDICFTDEDKLAKGIDSLGAFLFPYLNDINKIMVNGNSTSSSLIIQPEDEILIPIIFQYRFSDSTGLINENTNIDKFVKDENNIITFTKKIGIDMLLKNSVFRFDLQVTAKLNSKINSIDMASVRTNFNNESKENLV